MDGFYIGYFTGSAGNGIAMFALLNGIIVGADPMGVKFDGTYSPEANGFRIRVNVTVPAGGTTVQGVSPGSVGLDYVVDTMVPGTLDSVPYLTIPTPYGSVNVKFEKLRDA
jgi:hypothetical protein